MALCRLTQRACIGVESKLDQRRIRVTRSRGVELVWLTFVSLC